MFWFDSGISGRDLHCSGIRMNVLPTPHFNEVVFLIPALTGRVGSGPGSQRGLELKLFFFYVPLCFFSQNLLYNHLPKYNVVMQKFDFLILKKKKNNYRAIKNFDLNLRLLNNLWA